MAAGECEDTSSPAPRPIPDRGVFVEFEYEWGSMPVVWPATNDTPPAQRPNPGLARGRGFAAALETRSPDGPAV